MALIEIDVEPFKDGVLAKWSVKINAKDRTGLDDLDVNDLESVNDALDTVRDWMSQEVRF